MERTNLEEFYRWEIDIFCACSVDVKVEQVLSVEKTCIKLKAKSQQQCSDHKLYLKTVVLITKDT